MIGKSIAIVVATAILGLILVYSMRIWDSLSAESERATVQTVERDFARLERLAKDCTLTKITYPDSTLMNAIAGSKAPRIDFTCAQGVVISESFHRDAVAKYVDSTTLAAPDVTSNEAKSHANAGEKTPPPAPSLANSPAASAQASERVGP